MRWWRRERELREELDAHIKMAIQDRIERGEDPAAARAAVRTEFGNRGLIEETTRDIWGWRWLSSAGQDLRYAARGLANQPLFTSVAVASLALGIGANIAIFTVFYTVMLRTLPVQDPDRLVELLQKYPGEPRGNGYWTRSAYDHYRAAARSFSAIIGSSWDHQARIDSSAEPVTAEYVTPNYFSELGLRPSIGRFILEGDAGTAVLSDALWTTRFQRDPGVAGRKILVKGVPFTVIGVAGPSFRGLRTDVASGVWLPAKPDGGMALVARLKPGVTLEHAQAEMSALYRFTIDERLASSNDPLVKNLQFEMEPCGAGLSGTRDYLGRPITVLMAASAALLMLACLNLAGMLTARGTARLREVSVRLGLGASHGRLLRQFLTESLVLAALGTAAGAGVAYASVAWLLRMFTSGRPHQQVHLDIQPDSTLLLFAVATMLLTTLLFGLAPAVSALRQASRSAALRFRGGPLGAGRTLIALQVALSMALAASAGLFSAHLRSLRSTDLGFQRDGILLLSLDPSRSEYRGQKRAAGYRALIERFQNEPGVDSASLAAPTPLHGAGAGGWGTVEGRIEQPEERRRISISYAAPRYFSTLKIPLLAGRDFSYSDLANWRVAVINSTLARHYFSNPNDAIGKRITMDRVTLAREPVTYEIIGVAGDTNYGEIREDAYRGLYLAAFRDSGVLGGTLVIRTRANMAGFAARARRIVAESTPGVEVTQVRTLTDQIDSSIVPERAMAALSGFFGGLGLLLAGVGLYGLLAYSVSRRTNEIGVRMALGATPGRIATKITRETFVIVAAGVALGVPLSLYSLKAGSRLLPGVESTNAVPALALGGAAILLASAAAAWVPAWRASRVSPVEALRHD